jgi:hypothetical protein
MIVKPEVSNFETVTGFLPTSTAKSHRNCTDLKAHTMTKSEVVELPQDIIDNIIAAVGIVLKQCTLVSSSFLLPSRKQLFSRISLRSDESCQDISQNHYFQENQYKVPEGFWIFELDGWHITTCRSATPVLSSRVFRDAGFLGLGWY